MVGNSFPSGDPMEFCGKSRIIKSDTRLEPGRVKFEAGSDIVGFPVGWFLDVFLGLNYISRYSIRRCLGASIFPLLFHVPRKTLFYFFIHCRKDIDFDILSSILRMMTLHNRLLFSRFSQRIDLQCPYSHRWSIYAQR